MPIGPPSHSPAPKSALSEPSRPIERTIAAESGATGSASTRWLVEKSAGNSGQPAIVAAAAAARGGSIRRVLSAGGPGGAGHGAPPPPRERGRETPPRAPRGPARSPP